MFLWGIETPMHTMPQNDIVQNVCEKTVENLDVFKKINFNRKSIKAAICGRSGINSSESYYSEVTRHNTFPS